MLDIIHDTQHKYKFQNYYIVFEYCESNLNEAFSTMKHNGQTLALSTI